MNSQKIELPVNSENTKIFRSSQNEVQLSNSRGYSFKYDLVHDIFSLKVSGWYHGRVRGLLGWNDLEEVNDVVREDGTFVGVSEVGTGL